MCNNFLNTMRSTKFAEFKSLITYIFFNGSAWNFFHCDCYILPFYYLSIFFTQNNKINVHISMENFLSFWSKYAILYVYNLNSRINWLNRWLFTHKPTLLLLFLKLNVIFSILKFNYHSLLHNAHVILSFRWGISQFSSFKKNHYILTIFFNF